MKRILLVVSVFSVEHIVAQSLVDTAPSTKNVLMEAHTGVDCPSCPAGAQAINNYSNTYVGKIFAVQMHAFNTGHTTPINSGDQDLRRTHPDMVRQYMVDATGIPSTMMNRRYFNGARSFFNCTYPGCTQPIDSAIQQIILEPSPVNIGLEALYDTVIHRLVINTEIFVTDTALGDYRINVYLLQNNVVVTQNAYGTYNSNYNHKRVFREVITPTWGQSVSSAMNTGDLFVEQFFYDNDTLASLYNMQNMEVIVFITEHSQSADPMGEVIQVMSSPVVLSSAILTNQINRIENKQLFQVFPNPNYTKECWIKLENPVDDEVVYFKNIQGKVVFTENVGRTYAAYLDHQLPAGIYFVYLKSNPYVVQKLFVR